MIELFRYDRHGKEGWELRPKPPAQANPVLEQEVRQRYPSSDIPKGQCMVGMFTFNNRPCVVGKNTGSNGIRLALLSDDEFVHHNRNPFTVARILLGIAVTDDPALHEGERTWVADKAQAQHSVLMRWGTKDREKRPVSGEIKSVTGEGEGFEENLRHIKERLGKLERSVPVPGGHDSELQTLKKELLDLKSQLSEMRRQQHQGDANLRSDVVGLGARLKELYERERRHPERGGTGKVALVVAIGVGLFAVGGGVYLWLRILDNAEGSAVVAIGQRLTTLEASVKADTSTLTKLTERIVNLENASLTKTKGGARAAGSGEPTSPPSDNQLNK